MDQRVAMARKQAMVDAKDKYLAENLNVREPEDVDHDKLQRLSQAVSEIHAFGARMNGDPELMDMLAIWSVAVRCVQPVPAELIDSIAARGDCDVAVREAVLRQGGMAQAVVSAMKDAGYDIHGNEIATGGWRISVRCTESSSRRLCAILHRKFHKAIKSEVIFVERWFADFTLLGIRP